MLLLLRQSELMLGGKFRRTCGPEAGELVLFLRLPVRQRVTAGNTGQSEVQVFPLGSPRISLVLIVINCIN